MNTGVEILLKRMESNPEEFAYNPSQGMSKWGRLLDSFRHALTKEEIDAVDEGLRNVERNRFTQLVMQGLAGVEDEASDEGKHHTSPYLKNIATNGLTLTADPTASSGLTWASNGSVSQHILDAQKYQTEIMRRHLDEHREALNTMSKQDKSKLIKMLDSYVAYNKKKANAK